MVSSSLTRDQTRGPLHWELRAPAPGPAGKKSLDGILYKNVSYSLPIGQFSLTFCAMAVFQIYLFNTWSTAKIYEDKIFLWELVSFTTKRDFPTDSPRWIENGLNWFPFKQQTQLLPTSWLFGGIAGPSRGISMLWARLTLFKKKKKKIGVKYQPGWNSNTSEIAADVL